LDVNQIVQNVLVNRPALVRGRLSVRRPGSHRAFSREDKKYQSLPHGGPADSRGNGSTVVDIEKTETGIRRASSLPDLQPALSIESLDRGRLSELRKSTRRLKERIAEQ